MIKRLLTLIFLGVTATLATFAVIHGEWLQHPTFDNSVQRVIDSPDRVYFMGYNQIIDQNITFKSYPDMSLFYFDKEGDEIVAAASRHSLSNTAVRMAEYNPDKGYLLLIYDDEDIDLLYDNGNVVNIAALKLANIPGSKKVNFISFDAKNNAVWLATDFGYVVLDDSKYEVSQSRNYGVRIQAAARIGDKLILSTPDEVITANFTDPRLSLSDYTILSDIPALSGIYPLGDNRLLYTYTSDDKRTHLILADIKDSEPVNNSELKIYGNVIVNTADNGFMAMASTLSLYYKRDSKDPSIIKRVEDDTNILSSASRDQMDFYTVIPRKGLRSWRRMADNSYVKTRDFRMPNAPNAYISRGMAYHPRFGMLVNSHGQDGATNSTQIREPILLSALQNGLWTSMSPAYLNPEQTETGRTPRGLLIDPDNDKYVYMGSTFSGFTRLNLEDPQDILHYSFSGDETASLPGYVETAPIMQKFKRLCSFSPPAIDNNGIMWSSFANIDNTGYLEFRYLTAADRAASTDAASARPWRKISAAGITAANNCIFAPLKASVNNNLLFYLDQSGLMIYNHNGTLDNTSDDTSSLIPINSFTDQDGGTISFGDIETMYEDASGIVWIGVQGGIYYCQPRNLLQGQRVLNRVKVARNDGTSLADYLLNGIRVNYITADNQGRKWIGTSDAGIVVTSADGKTVLDEFNTDNSEIPSDIVYYICYNPSTNSMMVSTEKGLAEFFIGGADSGGNSPDSVRAYPNPVAPDYYGWVTIDNLPDNALVKIVDAQGNLVRELGLAESGTIQWDVNNLYNTRVKTGVYYILSSGSHDGGKESKVAKILVMN